MKTATDLAAVLTVHELDDGQYVLRIQDLRWRPLVVGVSKLLEDAKSLIVVTPSDIKVLRVSGHTGGSRPAPVARTDGAQATDPGYEETEAGPTVLDAEMQAEIDAAMAEQEGHPLPSAPPQSDTQAIVTTVKPEAGMRVVRRKPNGRPAAGHTETCGRCRGEGKIRIIEEGGGAGEAACGVCQGSGQIQRYGARR